MKKNCYHHIPKFVRSTKKIKNILSLEGKYIFETSGRLLASQPKQKLKATSLNNESLNGISSFHILLVDFERICFCKIFSMLCLINMIS